jgi:hypothetical protein
MIQRAEGDLSGAKETLSRSHELAVQSEDALLAAEAMRELGETHAKAQEFGTAREFFQQANALFTEMNASLDASAVQERLDQMLAEAATTRPRRRIDP